MERAQIFAVVETHTSPWDAHVSRALLESEGVPAYLSSEHIVTAWWPMSMVFGGVRLSVRAENLEHAWAVLAMRDRGELEAALTESFPPEVLRCARCGAEKFALLRSWSAVLLAFIMLVICKATFPPSKELRCVSCGDSRQ